MRRCVGGLMGEVGGGDENKIGRGISVVRCKKGRRDEGSE
jgi:hypothetical protein